ncbi:MAG: hypothetical protein WAN35_13795 [Terracidiphilus sp.]
MPYYEIAHQWWGSEVSPRTLNDAWIIDGRARYGELMVVDNENGQDAEDGAAERVGGRAGLRHDSAPARRGYFIPKTEKATNQ